MKKKIGLSLFAVLFIAIATMGTIAYFSKSFTSDKNTATAASFEVEAVNANGTVIGDAEFNLDGKLYPGMKTIEAYTFQINKNKTEVPVEYKVNVTPSGDLFPEDGTTPIVISMQRNVNGAWVDIDLSSTFKPESDTESFKILVNWPHGDNDIAFQGMTGNIKLDVVATQIDDEAPVDPNVVSGNVVNTVVGEAATEGKKSVYSYKFEEGYAPKMSNFKFHIYDGDGYVNEWFFGATQKIVNGVPKPRTGVEVAESIVEYIYVTQKGSFAPLTAKWDVTSVGSEVIFTSKLNKAYDNFKIVVPEKDNRAEIKGEFLEKQAGSAGHAGVKQVSTLTVQGSVQSDGNVDVSFSDGTIQVTKTINLVKNDSAEGIASKIAGAFSDLNEWDVTNSAGSADIVFTAKKAVVNKDITVTFTNN